MAQSLSDEQIQLRGKARRRLVGAIALVLVISAVLPMVLDNKPKPASQDIAIDIPKQDSVGFAPAPPPTAPAVQPVPVIPSPVAAAPAEKPAAKPGEKPAAARSEDKKPAAEKPAKDDKPAGNGGFVVQLGAFANAENARQLQSKLAANRIKTYTDTLKGPGGDKLRVRAGPYASREEADKALARIRQLGLDGKVVSK